VTFLIRISGVSGATYVSMQRIFFRRKLQLTMLYSDNRKGKK
jgi:hypothetical protein